MPEPMVPPPITATRSSRRAFAPAMPGTFCALRSAKNRCLSAFASALSRSVTNVARSVRTASANGVLAASRTISTALPTDGTPRAERRASPAAFSTSAASEAGTAAADSRRFPACATSARAAASRSPSTTRSTIPSVAASLAPTRRPAPMSAMARATPTSRGSRCVPPAPGRMPSFTSGSPTVAPAVASRRSQASASSNPPPSALPDIAATIGCRHASIARITSGSDGSSGASISRMSAPATKSRPAPVSTMPVTPASSANERNSRSSSTRTACESALTGGLSMVTTAMPPLR